MRLTHRRKGQDPIPSPPDGSRAFPIPVLGGPRVVPRQSGREAGPDPGWMLSLSSLQANALLVIAAALWGFGNVPQKTVLEHLDPMTAAGLRGLIAAVVLLPVLRPSRLRRTVDRCGLFCVAALFSIASVLQQAAYLDATVTNASVLVNLGVVLTPIFAWLLFRERLGPGLAAAACLAVGGLILMSGSSGSLSRGDMLAVASAVAYALWTIRLALHMRRGGSAGAVVLVQCLMLAAVALPVGYLHSAPTTAALGHALPDLLILGVFSTAMAFGLQAVALRVVCASHAALVVSS